MPFPDPKYEKNLKQRYHAYADTGNPEFNKTSLGMLDRDFKVFLKSAGIVMGEDGKVPETNGVPRIFVMGVDGQGVEKPMSLEAAGFDLSPVNQKFWQQVAMGNVFVYPAGAENPSQLHADPNEFGGDLGCSKPVAPENMPARQVRQPGFFARIMHAISGGRLYKEVAAYNNSLNAEKNLEVKSQLANMRDARELDRKAEETIALNAQREDEKKAHQAKLDEKFSVAQKKTKAFDDGYEILRSVYKPVPEKKEYLTKRPGKEGLYTDEHFSDLKVFGKDELDLSKIALAPKGHIGPSVSEKDFCAVAMFAGMHYSVAEGARPNDPKAPPVDIHAVSCLQKNLGISEQDARQICVEDIGSMYTADMFIVPRSRDNSGSYFKNGVNGARQAAADAFNAYKNGNKEPLAKILAFGIDRTCNQMVSLGSVPGNTVQGQLRMGVYLTTLMDKDPELKQLAFKNGMTAKQLKSVESLKDYIKLDDARKQAELKIAEAAAKGTKLSAEEKEACMKSIVKARLVDNIWLNEAKAQNEKTQEVEDKMMNVEMVSAEQNELWKAHPEMRPAPPEGKFWSDTGAGRYTYAQRLFRPTPPVLGSLKDQTSLDEIVDRIVMEDKLGSKSCEELMGVYDEPRTAGKLPARSIQIAQDIQNEKELGLDQNLNINQEVEQAKKEPQPAADDIDLDEPLNINAEIAKKQGGPQAGVPVV